MKRRLVQDGVFQVQTLNCVMPARSILIADDDAAIRGLLRAMLRDDKFEVDEASDGEEAMARMRIKRYDAVVLDLMMGPVNGFKVIEEIRAERPGQKFIIVVSAASQASIDKLEDESIFAKLRKPFDVHALLQAVRQCAQPLA